MTRIAGRYEIAAKLGEGGMGVVFRAYDPAPMDREVAVKTLHEFSDPLALELFYKECTALKSISHPNIVEIFDMGEYEEDGHKKPFFVMPLLPGETLDQIIRRASHRLTIERVVEIFAQTCRGLHAAHEHGLVHRDLKPSNIFVMADDSVKIIDFGVAHAVHARSRTTGYDKGTLLYMAPEQVQHKPVSVQSDIYSLGVTLYEALTRRQPFRGASEEVVIQAILSQIPPPASDLNPAVSHVISRVVHKAMAKQPWTRFDTAKEFGETLQKAYRNEPIALFDPSRTQPRIQTATKALEKGDFQFAGEIVSELEAEGNIDPQITLLRAEIDQVARQKTIGQLLESARARYEEEEDPLALQKLQEVLQLDPTNVAALGLKSKIDDRRSERQIEKWIQLARQHVDNHSYGHAREALQNALVLRPKDLRATRLLKEIEGEEQEYVRVRREKTDLYQAAVNAWKNGEVSQALSQMKHVLDLDQKAPDTSSPDAAGVYQSFYNKLRSEHDAISGGYADARRQLTEGELGKALQTCQSFLAKYPGLAVFQALKFDIEEQQRQRLSSFVADVDRRVEAEPDLDAKVHVVREALAEYPDEEHFVRLARLLEDKRDLVNSIVERARVHEGAGQIAEALNDLDTLQTIYATYPGLKFERERLQKRLEQQTRDTARARWVKQIDGQLDAGNYARAFELLDMAEVEFPADAELAELRKLATQGQDRAGRADQLIAEGQQLCAQGQFEQGVDLLQIALQLDDRTNVRMTLRDLFVARAQDSLNTDWRAVEQLADRALEIDPNHALAKSLRAQALDRKRDEVVGQHAEQARRFQAEGKLDAAMSEVETGLATYPNDTRLAVIADALKKELGRTAPPPAPAIEQKPAAPAPASPDIERTRLVPQRHVPPTSASAARSAPTDMEQTDGLPELAAVGTAVAEPVVTAPPAPPAKAPVTRPSSWMPLVWVAAVLVVVGGIGAWLRERRQPAVETPPAAVETTPAVPASPAPSPVPAPAPTETPVPEPQEPAAPALASLVLQRLPPGTSVRLDDMPIGTVGSDGTLSFTGITPGPHSLQVTARGYEPLKLSPAFTSGQALTMSAAEMKLVRVPATLELRADAGTEITIAQAGRVIQQVKAPARISLPDGKYDLTAKGPVGVPTTRPLVVSVDSPSTIDLRNAIVTGMERFPAAGWTLADSWSTRKGGNFVLYDRSGSQGTISFTIRMDRSGNPFSSGSRLNWVVGYADSQNYVQLQLDKDAFYRRVVANGTPQTPTTVPHRIPDNAPYVNLRVQLVGNRLVHEFATQENNWQVLDNWSSAGSAPAGSKRELLDGQFGFFLPGAEEIAISNFRYYPPIKP